MENLSIYEKLNRIQNELKAPKGQYNEFGKYSYRSCEDIFEAVKPLLQKYKLILLTDDELVYIGERYYIKAKAKLFDIENLSQIENIGYAREEEIKKGMDGSQITGASSSYARKYALNGLFLIDDNKDSDTTNVGEEITKEQAQAYKFGGKKHPNKTIMEVLETDPSYLQWWLDNGKDEDVKKMITLLTGMIPTPIPEEEEQNERLVLLAQMQDLIEKTNTDHEKILEHYGVESNAELSTLQLKEINDTLEARL